MIGVGSVKSPQIKESNEKVYSFFLNFVKYFLNVYFYFNNDIRDNGRQHFHKVLKFQRERFNNLFHDSTHDRTCAKRSRRCYYNNRL